jgi:hypothetical protein
VTGILFRAAAAQTPWRFVLESLVSVFLVAIAFVVTKEGEKDQVQSRLMMTMTDTYRRVAGIAKETTLSLCAGLLTALRWNRL